jgi:hypothetical protein
MAEVGCDDGTPMDFSATKNAHEIQNNCMFQNMLAILCGWAWNEKLQEEALVLHLGDACCKSFKNFRKNKKMKGVKEHIMFLTLHPIWIHKSFVLTT